MPRAQKAKVSLQYYLRYFKRLTYFHRKGRITETRRERFFIRCFTARMTTMTRAELSETRNQELLSCRSSMWVQGSKLLGHEQETGWKMGQPEQNHMGCWCLQRGLAHWATAPAPVLLNLAFLLSSIKVSIKSRQHFSQLLTCRFYSLRS